MAKRPVFLPQLEGPDFVKTVLIDFEWSPGLALSQARKSIESLHQCAKERLQVSEILEISTKSPVKEGVALSAFNLCIETVKYQRKFSVEAAYQASKVFERGGPYLDIFGKSSKQAKLDLRLRESGKLVSYRFFGIDWDLTPTTAFYDWLYLNALQKLPNTAHTLTKYDAFTDIAFNPERSLNCQAFAAALFVSLRRRNLLKSEILADKNAFLQVVGDGLTNRAINQFGLVL